MSDELLLKVVGYPNHKTQDATADRILKEVRSALSGFTTLIDDGTADEWRALARNTTDTTLRKAYIALAEHAELTDEEDE
jgi:hypothetical protein